MEDSELDGRNFAVGLAVQHPGRERNRSHQSTTFAVVVVFDQQSQRMDGGILRPVASVRLLRFCRLTSCQNRAACENSRDFGRPSFTQQKFPRRQFRGPHHHDVRSLRNRLFS